MQTINKLSAWNDLRNKQIMQHETIPYIYTQVHRPFVKHRRKLKARKKKWTGKAKQRQQESGEWNN